MTGSSLVKPLTKRQMDRMRREAEDKERQRLEMLRDKILALLDAEDARIGFYRTGEYDDCSGFITLDSKNLETVYVNLGSEIST